MLCLLGSNTYSVTYSVTLTSAWNIWLVQEVEVVPVGAPVSPTCWPYLCHAGGSDSREPYWNLVTPGMLILLLLSMHTAMIPIKCLQCCTWMTFKSSGEHMKWNLDLRGLASGILSGIFLIKTASLHWYVNSVCVKALPLSSETKKMWENKSFKYYLEFIKLCKRGFLLCISSRKKRSSPAFVTTLCCWSHPGSQCLVLPSHDPLASVSNLTVALTWLSKSQRSW